MFLPHLSTGSFLVASLSFQIQAPLRFRPTADLLSLYIQLVPGSLRICHVKGCNWRCLYLIFPNAKAILNVTSL